jgi:predicted NACHT family NTPase
VYQLAWKLASEYQEKQQSGQERPRLPIIIPLREYAKAVSIHG